MSSWLTDLRFWSQTRDGAKRELACNPDDAEWLRAAIHQAGLDDLISLEPMYIVPRRHAWLMGDQPASDELFEMLGINRWL
ncbi:MULTISPECIES: hypothetical protein [unclassified Nonomuraea]|uniref:hypothetical protein n=1 Tax=unclassified Nonomuraea TaxID=2593643 RepID=UPI0033F98C18